MKGISTNLGKRVIGIIYKTQKDMSIVIPLTTIQRDFKTTSECSSLPRMIYASSDHVHTGERPCTYWSSQSILVNSTLVVLVIKGAW